MTHVEIETDSALVVLSQEVSGRMTGWCKRIRPPSVMEELNGQGDDFLWLTTDIDVYWKDQ